MSIDKRKLGTQGLEVSSIGLGCMSLTGGVYANSMERKDGIKVIHKAIELGYTFFDTAEAYGPYVNEELLGEALIGKREKLIVATKFGFHIENGKMVGGERSFNSQPHHIREVVDASLKRLKTDYIDLLYQHRLDPNVPIEEVADTVKSLIKEGKVKFWGLSEVGVVTIRKAHNVVPLSAVQSEFSLWERNLEKDVIPVLKELGIGLVPFSPLGRGFLAGSTKKATDFQEGDSRRNYPRFQEENFAKNMQLIATIETIAKKHNASSSQIALAWVLAQGDTIVPIPGTKTIKYLEENIASIHVKLSTEDIQILNKVFAPENISGERYPEALMKMINR